MAKTYSSREIGKVAASTHVSGFRVNQERGTVGASAQATQQL